MNLLDYFLILAVIALIFWANEVARLIDGSVTWCQRHRVCGWCGRHQGGNPFAKQTHGICEHCYAKEMDSPREAKI